MPNSKRTRLYSRLLTHHLPLFAVCGLSVSALYFTRPYRDVLSRASFATAYPALLLLALTLLLGPWKLIRNQRQSISDDLRRDIGIWAGLLGTLHAVVGQCVHLRGRPWLYYVYESRLKHAVPLRHDLFGAANHTGAIATLLLLALLATSSDLALRRLGKTLWKRLQRCNYAIFGLVVVHAFGYQLVEKQKLPWVGVVALVAVSTVIVQAIGYRHRRVTLANRNQEGTPAVEQLGS